jgi:hypothetical protein
MAITDKTRKLLWARSGNRCVFCGAELIMEPQPGSLDNESVTGDECHINSPKPGGPRHDPTLSARSLDEYSNLILLCKTHHKLIDDQQTTYTAEDLRKRKLQHEAWVTQSLSNEVSGRRPVRIRSVDSPAYLVRITQGSDLIAIIDGMHASSFSHDDLVSEDEVELIGAFLESLQGWDYLLPDFEAGQRVRLSFQLTRSIEDLGEQGFWVFGARETQLIEGGVSNTPSDFPVAHLRVVRKTNPEIVTLGKAGAEAPERQE